MLSVQEDSQHTPSYTLLFNENDIQSKCSYQTIESFPRPMKKFEINLLLTLPPGLIKHKNEIFGRVWRSGLWMGKTQVMLVVH